MWFWYALYFALWTAVSTPLAKKLSRELSAPTYMFVSNVLSIPILFGIVLLLGGIPKVSAVFYPIMILSGMLDVVAFFAFVKAIKMAPISLIAPISSFNPIVTLFVAAVFLNEIPTPMKLLGVVVILLGAYLLNVSEIKGGLLTPFKKLFGSRGVQLFLLSNVIWGITPTIQKFAMSQITPSMPLYVSLMGWIVGAVVIAPFALPKIPKESPQIQKDKGLFLAIAVFGSLGAFAAFTAFSEANVGYVTAIFKLSVLFTVIFGGVFFKETHIKERFLGAAVMVIGTFLLVL